MATRTYLTDAGTDLESITLVAGHIAGIVIDNPSGSWLFVEGIKQYVPPYRQGWAYPVMPQQTSISVRFVDSPAGTVSNPVVLPVGQQVVVTLSDLPIPQSEGFTSGAGFQTSEVPLFAQARSVIRVDEVGNAVGALFVNTIPTDKLVITQVELIAFGSGTAAVRDQIVGNIGWGGAPPPNVVAYMAISPANPLSAPILDPLAAQLPAGEDITYSLISITGGGASDVLLAATYYRVVT